MIVGVDNLPTRANLAGHRLITVQAPDGSRYVPDLGLAHAMNSCPMNLISVSLLNQVGAIVHFERDHCYFQAHPGATKIPFDQRNGLFQLDVGRGGAPGTPRVAPSYALLGRCLATTVTMKLWHRRVRHLPRMSLLKSMPISGVVDGFKLKGKRRKTKAWCATKKNDPRMCEGATHPLDDGKNRLQVFADSDYATDQTRRSTMGSVVMMNGGPISWSSVLGKTVAMSTCEAEVNAAVTAVAKDALHLKQLLVDLDVFNPDTPLQIGEDNSACIA